MGVCAHCGNDYDNTFRVMQHNVVAEFDSFECAIAQCAPRCAHCAVTILGHGVNYGDTVYCCSHCARLDGAPASDQLDPAGRPDVNQRPPYPGDEP